jgi:hypothetical protein
MACRVCNKQNHDESSCWVKNPHLVPDRFKKKAVNEKAATDGGTTKKKIGIGKSAGDLIDGDQVVFGFDFEKKCAPLFLKYAIGTTSSASGQSIVPPGPSVPNTNGYPNADLNPQDVATLNWDWPE